MSTSPFIVISGSEPQIVGPFPSEKNAILFGESWQAVNNDNPCWQLSIVDDAYWEGRDVIRHPYDPAEEARQQKSFGPNFTISQIVDNLPMLITSTDAPSFLNTMISQALLSFWSTLGDPTRLFCLFEFDDVPELYQDQENAGTSKATWKWDLGTGGVGTIHSCLFGNDWRGLVITLTGGQMNDQTIYVIPQHAMDELSK